MAEGRPNILLLVWDAVRADFTTPYRTNINTTPTLSEIAQNGIKYNGAFAPSNWTGTSHGALFTGQYPSQSGVVGLNNQTLPKHRPTLVELLKNQGYRTYFRSSGTHLRENLGYKRGVDEYDITWPRVNNITNPKWYYKLLIDSSFRSLVRQRAFSGSDSGISYHLGKFSDFTSLDDQPWFAFMNLNVAHNPYNPPRPYKGYFDPDISRPSQEWIEHYGLGEQSHDSCSMERLERLSFDYPVLAGEFIPHEAEWATIRSWYSGAIRYLDDQLHWIRERLQAANEWKNTFVIVTSDHGEYFGEYGLEKHNFALYDPVTHIPMVFHIPENLEGGISQAQPPVVSLIDLYPTIASVAGADLPSATPGIDLLSKSVSRDMDRLVCSEVAIKATDAIENRHPEFDNHPENKSIQSIRTEDGVVHFGSDLEEQTMAWTDTPPNTSRQIEEPKLIERFKQAKESVLGDLPNKPGRHPVLDDDHREKLKSLGYI